MAAPRKSFNSIGQLQCSMCGEFKDTEFFSRNKKQSTGYNYSCKVCSTENTKKYNLTAKYGITTEDFANKLLDQNGCCACCGFEFQMEGPKELRPHVDHNHRNGEVRGLLCSRCNLAAGNLEDSSIKAFQVYTYLKKWNC